MCVRNGEAKFVEHGLLFKLSTYHSCKDITVDKLLRFQILDIDFTGFAIYQAMANTSIFFTLPLELRNQIYAYLVVGLHDVATPSHIDGVSLREFSRISLFGLDHPRLLMEIAWVDVVCDDFDLTWLNYPRPLMETSWVEWEDTEGESDVGLLQKHDYSILRVSRQIYEEASTMLYDFSIFLFNHSVSHLNRQNFPEIGDLERNLHRVRDLHIIISEDLFNRNITSIGIMHMLQWFARRTTSLQWFNIRFWAALTLPDHSIQLVLHDLLQATDLPETLCAFHVTNGLQIYIGVPDSSFPYDDYEKWPLYIAEKKDWKIRKHIDKVHRKGSDEPARMAQVLWTIKPGKIMRNGDLGSKEEEISAKPSNRIFKVVEHVQEFTGISGEAIELQ